MRLTLIKRKEEAADVESLLFEPQEAFAWRAGQFFHYVLHHEPTDERGSDRWFTCSAAPREGYAMITTRWNTEHQSTFKTALKNLKEGETIEISNVDGDFTVEDAGKQYVFIAGGIGITPFRAILKEADASGTNLNVTLLYGNRSEDIPFKKELDALMAKRPDFKAHYIVSPARIDEATVRQFVPDLSAPMFYVSGPEPMVESLGTVLVSMGIGKDRIKQDWFPGYPAE